MKTKSNNSNICHGDNYIIKENVYLTKTSKYYSIDYQYSVIEPNSQPSPIYPPSPPVYNPTPHDEIKLIRILNIKNRNLAVSIETNTYNKIYYGRTNRLKFKLCYDYRETCYELGLSEENQKCLSCLP